MYVVPTFAFKPKITIKSETEPSSSTSEVKSKPEPKPETEPSSSPEATSEVKSETKSETEQEFEFTDEMRSKVNEVLALYVGTHRFHNFTQSKKPTDESGKRYIMSFKVQSSDRR